MTWQQVGVEALNQSKIKTYLRCPRQFYFAYIKGIRQPPNLKLTVGTAVHKGIETNYAQKLKTKRDVKIDVVLDATNDEFKKAVKRDDIRESKLIIGKSADEAIVMAGAYHREAAPTLQPTFRPELEFSMPVKRAKRPFYGTIDLIGKYLKRGGALVVSDSKTTRRSYDKKRVHVDFQLTAYAFAAVNLFKQAIKYVMFDTVVLSNGGARSEQHVTNRTKDDLLRFEDTFQMVEKGIDAGVFPPTQNEQTCGWCGYRDRCFKGRVIG